MYNLIRTCKGKDIVFMTDTYAKCQKRMHVLKDSQRKGIRNHHVSYRIEETDEEKKFRKKPIGRIHW